MSSIEPHKTISKHTETSDDLDFQFLRKKGIEYIESLGGKLWTDYNSHDPGITILEVLSYAITDLGNRLNLPIHHLLADKNDTAFNQQFLSAHKALPIKPITALDYRKLFIDIDGVKNAWIKKHHKKVYVDCKKNELSYSPFANPKSHHKDFTLNGLYDILIEIDELDTEIYNTKPKINQKIKSIKENIKTSFHSNRNLCEDLVSINVVQEYPVKICAHIELEPQADEENVYAFLLNAIDDYLSPDLNFYTLKELLDSGYTTEEIYNGPLLQSGFLKHDELLKTELKKEVRLSDLIDRIQKIEGILVIRDITLNHCNGKENDETLWNICIPDGKKPARCDKSSFSFFKGHLPLNTDKERVQELLNEINNQKRVDIESIALANKELSISTGVEQQTGAYYSIQNDLPEVYATGPLGIKPSASTQEKAKAKQLKAYLLFFDQILATYFAQLHTVKDLLSINGTLDKSYFTQLINDVKDIETLVSSAYDTEETISELVFDGLDQPIEKHQSILDHLLARFAENFSDYAFLMKQLYGQSTNQAVLETKRLFLKNYEKLGNERGLSFNFYKQAETDLWDTPNVSTFEKRIALLSGNTNFNRRNFSDDALEIYEEIDTDDIVEYRFRIRNTSNKILLSGSKHYHNLNVLYQEIFDVRNYGRFTENYKIRTTTNGKFHIVLINPHFEHDPSDERKVIGRRISYFNSHQAAANEIEKIAEFINEMQPNEGMYVIEHILLRPDVTKNTAHKDDFLPICAENCEGCEGLDPYSFRVSIILPGWTERYSNIDFRNFMENLIREELPAHIVAKICWIGWPQSYDTQGENNQMMLLEDHYKAWLISKTNIEQKQDIPILKDLINTMSSLNTIYHQGRLHNCDKKGAQQHILLGRTNMGKL